jgi:DNA polymerase
MKQIELIEPLVICTLGNFATKCLTGRQDGITRVHGRPQERVIAGLEVKVFPIFHPAAGLRSGPMLTTLREDFQRLPELLAEARPEPEPVGVVAEPTADQLDLFD